MMEGKLIKTKTGFYLWRNPLNKSQEILGATVPIMNDNGVDLRKYKLSLKNCQTIENGYDLDELTKEEAKKLHDWYKHSDTDIYNQLVREDAELIKIGFQKALEILGDKKFDESDMWDMFYFGDSLKNQIKSSKIENKHMGEIFDDYIKSLQQTEWDVIIEMECPECKEWGYISECRNNCNQKFLQPKLDNEGNLILKRI